MTAEEPPNAWCFGCSKETIIAPDQSERRCREAECNGLVRRVVNRAALEVGQLCFRMRQGCYTHSAAMWIASQPGASILLPDVEPGNPVPVGRITRRDGSSHVFDLSHYLHLAAVDPFIADDLSRTWMIGAFLAVGDAMGRSNYFDHAPELELVRHIRNGIAHNNRFRFDPAKLARFPAHNRFARSPNGRLLEILPSVEDTEVLFGFAGPADLLDLLTSVEAYLLRMALGDQLRSQRLQ